jgi:hypothetical protein
VAKGRMREVAARGETRRAPKILNPALFKREREN